MVTLVQGIVPVVASQLRDKSLAIEARGLEVGARQTWDNSDFCCYALLTAGP